jgi:hypothetical protein
VGIDRCAVSEGGQVCRVLKYLVFVVATAIISPAMAQNSKSCQSFVGVWTYTQQGFSGDFVRS